MYSGLLCVIRMVSEKTLYCEKIGIKKITGTVKGNCMGILKSTWNRVHKNKIFKACKNGDEPQVFSMLKEEPELAELKDRRGLSPLFYAVEKGHSKIAEAILKITNRPDEVEPEKGFSPLLLATTKGYKKVVGVLLEYGANPDVQSTDGITALHNAVYKGQLDIANMLLKAGADPTIKDRLENTAVDLASQSNNSQIKKLFPD